MPQLKSNKPPNKPIASSSHILIVLVLILLAGGAFLSFKYISLAKELRQAQAFLETQNTNDRVLEFTTLFIDKVLEAETEVDFETRLKLENAVRDLKDNEILVQWQKFIESNTEDEAQKEVKNLLEILIGKIKAR